MQPLVGLQVASATEPLMANLAFMRLLSCVDQVVFLQVGQLREVLIAGLTPEGTLSAVHSQMDLEVGQLPEDLSTYIAVITDLSILPGEGVRQSLVANNLPPLFGLPEVHGILWVALRGRGGFGREAV